jgi:predicted nucleic acid-binding protein
VTRYLLDTSTLIDVSKGIEPVRSRVLALLIAGDEVGLCAVGLAEFAAGLAVHQRRRWPRLLTRLHYWRITREAAARAGYYRYDFARRGRAIATPDALIAATAWHWQATLVTDNIKDFPMTDIRVVSFRI